MSIRIAMVDDIKRKLCMYFKRSLQPGARNEVPDLLHSDADRRSSKNALLFPLANDSDIQAYVRNSTAAWVKLALISVLSTSTSFHTSNLFRLPAPTVLCLFLVMLTLLLSKGMHLLHHKCIDTFDWTSGACLSFTKRQMRAFLAAKGSNR